MCSYMVIILNMNRCTISDFFVVMEFNKYVCLKEHQLH
jgi:hypothetical protein